MLIKNIIDEKLGKITTNKSNINPFGGLFSIDYGNKHKFVFDCLNYVLGHRQAAS